MPVKIMKYLDQELHFPYRGTKEYNGPEIGLVSTSWLLQGLFDRILSLNSTPQYGHMHSPFRDIRAGAMGLVI